MLKAGILEIGDVFVVNKADMDGADRLIAELKQMLHRGDIRGAVGSDVATGGHHGAGGSAATDSTDPGQPDPDSGGRSDTDARGSDDDPDSDASAWDPRVVTTAATTGEGIDTLIDAFDAHTLSPEVGRRKSAGTLAPRRRDPTARSGGHERPRRCRTSAVWRA